VKRSRLASILLASLASPAFADDLTVTTTVNNPIATSKASNGTAGNITINSNATVSIGTAGAAVTLDSNNAIANMGLIQNYATASGAIGAHILGGVTGSFTNDGASGAIINLPGNSAGSFGVLLDGASAFNGNINLTVGGSLTVTGLNATGVAIKAPLNGDLTVGANTTMVGEGATGVLVLAPISGSLSATLGMTVSGTYVYTVDKVDPLTGSAIAVGSSIGGGILNGGPKAADDSSSPTSTLVTSSLAPALAIQPSIAGAGATNIAIGLLADAVNPNLSLINRGNIRDTENDPGISTIAVGIGELGAAAHSVTLAGGIYNRGSIVASAESDNRFAGSVAAAAADATAVLIGNGASVNASAVSPEALRNEGTIIASELGSLPSTSTGVLILAGGSLPSITNAGVISANISSSDATIASLAAYGIRDLSGTLTTVNNSGRLGAQASLLNNNAQLAIAADLSHGATNQTFTDSGTVVGEILFGSAANQLVIEGASATVQSAVRAAGSGTIDVHLSDSAAHAGGAFRTPSAQITTLTVGSGGTVEMSIDKNSAAAPIISATGAVTFGAGSKVSLVPSSFLPDNGTYTLIHSGGALTFTDFAASTTQPIPFIFNGGITHDTNNLLLTLQRKSATQLGLSGNLAAIYEPFAVSALTDSELGAALLSLGSAAEVQAVVNASVPDVAGAVRALTIAMTDQATGVIGARGRGLVMAPAGTRDELRFWGQEFYNMVSSGSTATTPGYGGAGQGVAFGIEWGSLATGRYGIGYTFFSSQETETHPRDTKTNGDWNLISVYGGWRAGGLFVTPEATLGQGDFHSRRGIVAGPVSRSAAANWSSYLAAGGLTTGYIMDVAGFQLVPQIAVDGLYMREGAYTEARAGGMNLSLDPQNQQSVRSFAGVLGQGTYVWDNGNFQPQLLIGWSHEFLNTPATIDGSFESAPGSPFHLVGPTLEPNKIIGGASLAYVLGNWSAGINYDASANSGSLAQSATISLSSRF
jgi:hypothetical protein